MNVAEHFTAGLVIGCGVGYVVELSGVPGAMFAVGASAVLGSVICDIDIPDSFIGAKVRPISSLINMTVGHRTFFHSLLFMLLLGYLFGMIYIPLGVGIGLGILSHIVLDMFNGNGVAYLYPFKKNRIKWFKILE